MARVRQPALSSQKRTELLKRIKHISDHVEAHPDKALQLYRETYDHFGTEDQTSSLADEEYLRSLAPSLCEDLQELIEARFAQSAKVHVRALQKAPWEMSLLAIWCTFGVQGYRFLGGLRDLADGEKDLAAAMSLLNRAREGRMAGREVRRLEERRTNARCQAKEWKIRDIRNAINEWVAQQPGRSVDDLGDRRKDGSTRGIEKEEDGRSTWRKDKGAIGKQKKVAPEKSSAATHPKGAHDSEHSPQHDSEDQTRDRTETRHGCGSGHESSNEHDSVHRPVTRRGCEDAHASSNRHGSANENGSETGHVSATEDDAEDAYDHGNEYDPGPPSPDIERGRDPCQDQRGSTHDESECEYPPLPDEEDSPSRRGNGGSGIGTASPPFPTSPIFNFQNNSNNNTEIDLGTPARSPRSNHTPSPFQLFVPPRSKSRDSASAEQEHPCSPVPIRTIMRPFERPRAKRPRNTLNGLHDTSKIPLQPWLDLFAPSPLPIADVLADPQVEAAVRTSELTLAVLRPTSQTRDNRSLVLFNSDRFELHLGTSEDEAQLDRPSIERLLNLSAQQPLPQLSTHTHDGQDMCLFIATTVVKELVAGEREEVGDLDVWRQCLHMSAAQTESPLRDIFEIHVPALYASPDTTLEGPVRSAPDVLFSRQSIFAALDQWTRHIQRLQRTKRESEVIRKCLLECMTKSEEVGSRDDAEIDATREKHEKQRDTLKKMLSDPDLSYCHDSLQQSAREMDEKLNALSKEKAGGIIQERRNRMRIALANNMCQYSDRIAEIEREIAAYRAEWQDLAKTIADYAATSAPE